MKKLTWLSKIILILIGIAIIGSIVWFSNWIFNLKKNDILLSISDSTSIKKTGLTFKNPKKYIKVNTSIQELFITEIIQSSDDETRVVTAVFYYTYDLDWVKKNKKLPEKITIPTYCLEHYMMNSSSQFTLSELKNRKLIISILNQFFEKTLDITGYKIIRIIIPYPLFTIEQARMMHIFGNIN